MAARMGDGRVGCTALASSVQVCRSGTYIHLMEMRCWFGEWLAAQEEGRFGPRGPSAGCGVGHQAVGSTERQQVGHPKGRSSHSRQGWHRDQLSCKHWAANTVGGCMTRK
eukprot:EG_transcript_44324